MHTTLLNKRDHINVELDTLKIVHCVVIISRHLPIGTGSVLPCYPVARRLAKQKLS